MIDVHGDTETYDTRTQTLGRSHRDGTVVGRWQASVLFTKCFQSSFAPHPAGKYGHVTASAMKCHFWVEALRARVRFIMFSVPLSK